MAEAGIAAEPLCELPHGQILTPGEIDRPLTAALRSVALGEPIEPMTLGNMRGLDGRRLFATCRHCGLETEVNIDA
jgi:hypothetical protein